MRAKTLLFLTLVHAEDTCAGNECTQENCIDSAGTSRTCGDCWSPDACKSCQCLPDGSISCSETLCDPISTCPENYEISTESSADGCCNQYFCIPTDCDLPSVPSDCPADTCGRETLECTRTCLTGPLLDELCPEHDIIKTGDTCDPQACLIDCDLPECSSTSCIGEQVQCIRTCENGIYGDAGCLESDIIQTHTCLPGDCTDCIGVDPGVDVGNTCFDSDGNTRTTGECWRKDPCTTCQCGSDGLAVCTATECDALITCPSGFNRFIESPGDGCCQVAYCVQADSTTPFEIDCDLPACPTDTCGGEQYECKRICYNGFFGSDCAGDEIKTVTCPVIPCVVDCDVTCPTDTCGGEQVTCSRTCANGDFGIDAECLSENETKSVTCPALPGSACDLLSTHTCPASAECVSCCSICPDNHDTITETNPDDCCPFTFCVALDCDVTCPDLEENTCGGEEIECTRTCLTGDMSGDELCPDRDIIETKICDLLPCLVDCDLPECLADTCGGEIIECSRTCPNGAFGVDTNCSEEDEIKSATCPLLACIIDCDLPDCPLESCGEEPIECTRTCLNGEFGIDAACPAEDEIKTATCPALPCIIDCDLPDCFADTCGGETIECTRTCLNGVFGVDAPCPVENENKSEICPLLPCIVDCDLPDCPLDTCGEEPIECTRTCLNGDFGIDAACPTEDETKTSICSPLPCIVDCDLPECPAEKENTCGGEFLQCSRTCLNADFGTDAACPVENRTKTIICPVLPCKSTDKKCPSKECWKSQPQNDECLLLPVTECVDVNCGSNAMSGDISSNIFGLNKEETEMALNNTLSIYLNGMEKKYCKLRARKSKNKNEVIFKFENIGYEECGTTLEILESGVKHFNHHLKFVTDYPEPDEGELVPSGEREKIKAIDSSTLSEATVEINCGCFFHPVDPETIWTGTDMYNAVPSYIISKSDGEDSV